MEPPKGLIPLIAAVQHRIGKVHLVMDYRDLNGHVDAFTVDTDDCNKNYENYVNKWRMCPPI